jgi:hypothetical protein
MIVPENGDELVVRRSLFGRGREGGEKGDGRDGGEIRGGLQGAGH